MPNVSWETEDISKTILAIKPLNENNRRVENDADLQDADRLSHCLFYLEMPPSQLAALYRLTVESEFTSKQRDTESG
jgi:hypothetical protein